MEDPRDAAVDRREDAPGGLFLARSGVWFHDGDRVRHRGLSTLLHHGIGRDAAGSLVVTTGRDVEPFVSEDAPLHVRTLEGGVLVFADGAREPCAGRTFLIDDEGRVRCASQRLPLWALLSRTATQLLVATLDDGGRLQVPDGPCPLERTLPRAWDAPPT